jgi:hypothetical protein
MAGPAARGVRPLGGGACAGAAATAATGGNYFSNVLFIVTFCRKYVRTPTFENLWQARKPQSLGLSLRPNKELQSLRGGQQVDSAFCDTACSASVQGVQVCSRRRILRRLMPPSGTWRMKCDSVGGVLKMAGLLLLECFLLLEYVLLRRLMLLPECVLLLLRRLMPPFVTRHI